jgi:hypothetical protein
MHTNILRSLREAVKKKRPEKWRTNSLFILHNNAPAHRSVLIKNFFVKSNVIALEHPTYSPDLPTHDFYLFLLPKSTLNGRHFCGATDIIKNATEELKRFL